MGHGIQSGNQRALAAAPGSDDLAAIAPALHMTSRDGDLLAATARAMGDEGTPLNLDNPEHLPIQSPCSLDGAPVIDDLLDATARAP